MPIELTNIGRTYHLEGSKSDLQLTLNAKSMKALNISIDVIMQTTC